VSKECQLPAGIDENELLKAIDKTTEILSHKFADHCGSVEDVHSQVALFAIQAIRKGGYDPSRPLGAFIFTHCKNRLLNETRRVRRYDSPCKACKSGAPCGSDGRECEVYRHWAEQQARKAKVRKPHSLDQALDDNPNAMPAAADHQPDAEVRDALSLIDAKLPLELRAFYLQMRAGVDIGTFWRQAVEDAILEILSAAGLADVDQRLGDKSRYVSSGRMRNPPRRKAQEEHYSDAGLDEQESAPPDISN
jgi:hypothetical protein